MDSTNAYSDLTHPILILIRGLPGSGKSYLAYALEQAIGERNVVMLDPDAIDYTTDTYSAHTQALSTGGVDEKLHPYRFLRAQAYAGITSSKIIIWNQPFTNLDIFEKMIAGLLAYTTDHGTSLPVLVVEVIIDQTIAKQRVIQRKQEGGHGPSDNTFARFVREYETAASLGYTVISVNGSDEVRSSVELITKAIQALIVRQ
jgi:predicted ABC-type ATPase